MRCVRSMTGSGSPSQQMVMRCFGRWCWPGWSSRWANSTQIRVLTELGIPAPGYRTIFRRLPVYAQTQWRERLSAACAEQVGLGPATLVLYDVTTLLCRRRHNNVYADVSVMPMFGLSVLVRV